MRKRVLCAILAVLMICTAGCKPKPEPSAPSISPSISEPGTSNPDVTTPSITEPSTTEPPTTTPSVTEPSVTPPSQTDSPSTEPNITEPPITEPPVTQPPIVTGWQEVGNKRYYYDADGTPHVGWLELDGDRYYFRADGSMATGRVVISSKETRYFASTGKEVILVNPWNYVPDDYKVTLTTYGDFKMAQEVKAPLKQMLADCKSAGFEAVVVSAHRTHSYQKGLFERRIERFMNQGYNRIEATIEAAKRVAVPGTSEHELGLALDITDKDYQNLNSEQEKKPAQIWIMNNCWKYGFTLRYPNEKSEITGIIYEPWHYRYVGVELATELHELGLCLEEYFEMLTDPNEPPHHAPVPEYPELIPTEPTVKPSNPATEPSTEPSEPSTEPTKPHVCTMVFAFSKAATCEEGGTDYYTCTGCHNLEERPIPPLGHSFVPATCTAPAYCLRCNTTAGVARPHSYGMDGLCMDCGSKDPDFISTMKLTITVKTDKNAYVPGITVHIYVEDVLIASGKTDASGVARFTIPTCNGYVVRLTAVPAQLEHKESYAYSSAYGNIVLKTRSTVTMDNHSQANYQVGSIVGDFLLTDSDGNSHQLYELLAEKNAVVLNFWYINCSPCKEEFPFLNTAYEQYKDSVALLAITPFDRGPAISALKESMQIQFPMMEDTIHLSEGFHVNNFPTTVIIGQGGKILYIHTGMYASEEEVLALLAPFAF